MSIAREIGKINRDMERHGRVGEFFKGIRYLMLSPKGDPAKEAERTRAPDRVVNFVKAAITPGTTLTGQWGVELANIENLPQAFLSSLQGTSVFDTLFKDMLVLPPRTKVVVMSSVLTSNPIAEAHVKPSTVFSLSAADLEMKKAAPWCAVTEELLKMGVPSALMAVQRGLSEKMTRACNTIFIAAFSGVTSFASSGVTSTGVRQDLRTLLSAVSSGSESRLYLIATRTIVEALSVLTDSAGAAAFPGVQYNGGSIAGIPIIPVDEMASGEILLLDATQVAAASEPPRFDISREPTIQIDDTGDSPPLTSTIYASCWELNLAAIKIERYIGVKLLRTDGAAKITGVGYVGNSPA
jgi:hypothetical protein